MLAFFVENPPVGIVVKAWQIESKVSMPAILRAIISIKVIPTYIIHKNFAVSRTLGLILSATGPGTSALKS